jgi:hypothetical protein
MLRVLGDVHPVLTRFSHLYSPTICRSQASTPQWSGLLTTDVVIPTPLWDAITDLCYQPRRAVAGRTARLCTVRPSASCALPLRVARRRRDSAQRTRPKRRSRRAVPQGQEPDAGLLLDARATRTRWIVRVTHLHVAVQQGDPGDARSCGRS